jgi:hypothetical protein
MIVLYKAPGEDPVSMDYDSKEIRAFENASISSFRFSSFEFEETEFDIFNLDQEVQTEDNIRSPFGIIKGPIFICKITSRMNPEEGPPQLILSGLDEQEEAMYIAKLKEMAV